MLFMTAKLTKRKIIAWVLIIGVVICAAIVLLGEKGGDDAIIASESRQKRVELKNIKSNEDRIALLNSFGWETGKDPLEFMEVRIPEEFDEVYQKYNKIQNEQGLDLKKYAGKRAMRYTYQVINHPSGEQGVIANILIYKNRLIAGDICSPQLNGFMHGLIKPSEVSEETRGGKEKESEGESSPETEAGEKQAENQNEAEEADETEEKDD